MVVDPKSVIMTDKQSQPVVIADEVADAATKWILEDKRPKIGEIELTLFENCHLNCFFCHHDKKSTVG